MTEFPPNGATSKATGQAISGTISNSFCVAPAVISGYKSVKLTTDADNNTKVTAGDTLTWTLSYANTGAADATSFQVADALPTGVRDFQKINYATDNNDNHLKGGEGAAAGSPFCSNLNND